MTPEDEAWMAYQADMKIIRQELSVALKAGVARYEEEVMPSRLAHQRAVRAARLAQAKTKKAAFDAYHEATRKAQLKHQLAISAFAP